LKSLLVVVNVIFRYR